MSLVFTLEGAYLLQIIKKFLLTEVHLMLEGYLRSVVYRMLVVSI